VKYESERICKKAVVAQFKVISRHAPGGTKIITKTLSQDSRSSGRDLKPGRPEYEARVFTTRPLRSVVLHVLTVAYTELN
jgi:hypothetical protein